MKILLVHNYYQQYGGEEVVLHEEKRMLEKNGHHVILYTRSSDEITRFSFQQKIKLPFSTLSSRESYRDIQQIIQEEKPDIAHFHNTLPLISPSAYSACQNVGVPVVQTLHNYRLLCLPSTFFRDGNNCEQCLGKSFLYPGIYHACYRNSRAQSAVVASMLFYHHIRGTWKEKITHYIALTQFAREKFIQGGIPEEKILVKPNFVSDPGEVIPAEDRHFAIYVGRLSKEKGIFQLVEAWSNMSKLPLKIVGTGPMEKDIKIFIRDHNLQQVEMLGGLSHEEVMHELKFARFLVFPTQVYETFGRVVIEAYACGIPVVASRIGAVEELVIEGETGLLFDPHNIEDLVTKIQWMHTHPQEIKMMGANARREYEQNYTPGINYQKLIGIYEIAMKSI